MPERFPIRSQAYERAKQHGYKGFRTIYEPENDLWKLIYEPGESSPAAAWAKDKPFVAWTEVAWIDVNGDDSPKRAGVIIVTCTREELTDEDIPVEFIVEPITLELFEPERAKRRAVEARETNDSAPRAPRARSDAESPVKTVWRIAGEMVGASRADVIAACVAAGVNKATASTQYYRWAKAQAESA